MVYETDPCNGSLSLLAGSSRFFLANNTQRNKAYEVQPKKPREQTRLSTGRKRQRKVVLIDEVVLSCCCQKALQYRSSAYKCDQKSILFETDKGQTVRKWEKNSSSTVRTGLYGQYSHPANCLATWEPTYYVSPACNSKNFTCFRNPVALKSVPLTMMNWVEYLVG